MFSTLNVQSFFMVIVFIVGYLMITFEHYSKMNKATLALLMAVICWILQFSNPLFSRAENLSEFQHHLANISQIVFFLIGALTIVELINVHQGFQVVSDMICVKSKKSLLWIIGIISFFLSAILDNLTTTVVMITLLPKLVDNKEDKLLIGGGVVIAANAGGAWTPIGDVTTTMLWIGGQLSALNIIRTIFLPSLVCFIVSMAFLSLMLKGPIEKSPDVNEQNHIEPKGKFVLSAGICCLIFVPFFSLVTGLPPFMGMLFGLSVMWVLTDWIHGDFKNRDHLRVPYVLSRIDLAGTLFFFLGILFCIDALETAKILEKVAVVLDKTLGNVNIIAAFIGVISAIIDNVPLVAATMGMYELSQYPSDHAFWNLIAYCAGTGGSILLIGSAAGIVFMGLEKVDFQWYLKRISLPALAGYFAGIGVFLLLE
jgi:NhaD family Na+/H+ antiporter